VLGAQLAVGQQSIVRSTHHPQIFNGVGAAELPGAFVVKLQKGARLTTVPGFANE